MFMFEWVFFWLGNKEIKGKKKKKRANKFVSLVPGAPGFLIPA